MSPIGHLVERVAPAALGGGFRRILAASVFGNLGDGILIAAGPLLAASITSDPLLVALAAVAGQLPWVLVSLPAGIIIDRAPRVRLMVLASWGRALVLAAMVGLLLAGALGVPGLYLCLFLLGAAEVFLDTAWSSAVPDLVPSEHLGVATARLTSSQLVLNQLAGPALGGLLFAAAHALPYGVVAVTTLLAAWIIAGLRIPQLPSTTTASIPVAGDGALVRLRRDLGSGMRWLWGNLPIRALAVTMFVFNITFGMTWGVLVLYAREVLGLDAAGYGLLMACSAVGGLLGAGSFGWLERRMSYARMMQTLLCIEVLVHVALALSAHWIAAAATLFVFGAYSAVWGTVSMTIRGRAVPSRMRGRVSSVYLLGMFGGIAIGMPIGGAIAQQAGVVAPMWWAAGGTAIALAIVWPLLPAIGRAGEASGAPAEAGDGSGDDAGDDADDAAPGGASSPPLPS